MQHRGLVLSFMQMRLWLAAVLIVGVGFIMGAGAPGAGAHDSLVDSNPQPDSTVTSFDSITLTFSANVIRMGTVARVTDPTGAVVGNLAQVSGTRVTIPVDPTYAGKYEVVWKVTSSDGHPISGRFFVNLAGTYAAVPAEKLSLEQSFPAGSQSTRTGPSSPTTDWVGDNMVPLILSGAAVVAVIAVGLFVVRKRFEDDPH